MITQYRMRAWSALLMLSLTLLALPASGKTPGATGIVASIDNAPVVANGDVAGAPTDYLITLDGSLDPNAAGRSLRAGKTIKVFLPPEFDLSELNPAYPVEDVPFPFPPVPPLPERPCLPGNLQCSTVIILRGWPQDPLFPPRLFYRTSIDEVDNAIVITAEQDIVQSPGIKQIHLIFSGLTNPKPGFYRLKIEAETGPDGSVETGEGLLRVRSKPAPSINVTAVFVKALSGQLEGGVACGPGTNPPNPDNPIYQNTALNAPAPFAWSFLVWGDNGEPLDDLKLRRIAHNFYKLERASGSKLPWWKRAVGYVQIETPPGARNQRIEQIDCPQLLPQTPVIGATPGVGPQPVGRLDLKFTAGNKAGVYRTKLWLRRGNKVEMVVTAE